MGISRAISREFFRRGGGTLLSIAIAAGEPPTEFRLFSAGNVETTKGTFVFDADSAKSVMAEYEAHGIDLAIDYDHAMLSPMPVDPALSGKAAGWFNLEVRNGELWAVNVRWTEPAAAALRAKEWRFMSPAFSTDDRGHITSLLNVAITNIPATRRLEPLMAASARETLSMAPELIKKALEAIKNGDADAAMALLEDMIAGTGEPAAEEPTEPEVAADKPAEEEEEKPAEVAAALSVIQGLSGKSLVASVADIRAWYTSHVELATERRKLAEREAVLEGAERRRLCVDLVTRGGKAPAEVWATSESKDPKSYLAAMPLAHLRDFVAEAIKAHGGKPAKVTPPTGGAGDGSKEFATPHGSVTLSASEIYECKRAGANPEVYAANKAIRAKRAGSKGSDK